MMSLGTTIGLLLFVQVVQAFPAHFTSFTGATLFNQGHQGPFVKLGLNDINANNFGVKLVLAYNHTIPESKQKCQKSCQANSACAVAVYCSPKSQKPCFPGDPSCTASVNIKTGTCNILLQAKTSKSIPADKLSADCEYIFISK